MNQLFKNSIQREYQMKTIVQLIMICFALSSVQLISADSSASSDIKIVPAAMQVGTVTVFKNKRGEQSLTYVGRDGELFYYEHRDLYAPKDGIFKHWRDSKGRTTSLKYFGRVTQTYDPHNCRFAIGRCEYTYINENTKYKKRSEYKVIVIGELIGERRWSYKRYHKSVAPENLRRSGWVEVDEYGIDIESKSTSYRKSSKNKSKLISRRSWRKRVSQEKPAN